MPKSDSHLGFEQGPYRPSHEAGSLALRLVRKCPWNRCTFCRTYGDGPASMRSLSSILKDIELVRQYAHRIPMIIKPKGQADSEMINTLYNSFEIRDRVAFNAVMGWHHHGMKHIFFQDSDPLAMPVDELLSVLNALRNAFPSVERISASTRSRSLARMHGKDLERLARAGLDRIYLGVESGSNRILARIRKGMTRETHIQAGAMVKSAGIELAVSVIPGLGGMAFSVEHALETASALNAIDPDHIFLQSLVIPRGSILEDEEQRHLFERMTDAMVAKEIRLLLESLMGIHSHLTSDHPFNLFENIHGQLPDDQGAMVQIIDEFFDLSDQDRVYYQMGRRMGYFKTIDDMKNTTALKEIQKACDTFGVNPDTVDGIVDEMKKYFAL